MSGDSMCQSIKIEFSLEEPVARENAKAFARSILEGYLSELHSISYAYDKHDELVRRIVVCFRTSEAGEDFFAKIDEGQESLKIFDLIKNVMDNGEDCKNESLPDEKQYSFSSTDSVYVINDDCAFIDNQTLIIETNYFDGSIDQWPVDTNEQNAAALNSIQESSHSNKTLSASGVALNLEASPQPLNNDSTAKTEEATVEINSDRPISCEDLDAILIFFENEEASGGSDIVDHKLSPSLHQLHLTYKNQSAKTRLLQQQYIHFKQYKFQITEPFEAKHAQLDPRSFILTNLPSNQDLALIRMLAENLSKQNCVEKLVRSSVFANTYYVSYKEAVELEEVRRRLARRPKLQNQSIEIYPAEVSRTLILRPRKGKCEKKILDLNFKFKSIRNLDSFYLVQFESSKDMEENLEHLQELAKSFMVENLFSFDLLEKAELESKSLFYTAKKFSAVFFLFLLTAIFATAKFYPGRESTNKIVTKRDEVFKPVAPVFHMTVEDEPNLKVLFYWNELHFDSFETDLLELNARPKIIDKSRLSIECTLNFDATQNAAEYEKYVSKWRSDLNAYLRSFFDEFETRSFILRVPFSSLENIPYNLLRVYAKYLDSNETYGKIEICGYKDDVRQLVAKLNQRRAILN